MYRKLSLPLAGAALLASSSLASAFALNGGSVGLGYAWGNFDARPDVNTTTLDATASFALTDQIGLDAFVAAQGYDTNGHDTNVHRSSWGLSPSFALSPEAKLGLFFERSHNRYDGLSFSTDYNVYGVEGAYQVAPEVTLSAYYGKFDKSDFGSTFDHSYGLRADLALGDGFGLYASFQEDKGNSYLQSSAVGVSYDLKGVTNMPLQLDAGYTKVATDTSLGGSDAFSVGVRYLFGPKGTAPHGFLGDHSAIGTTALPFPVS